MNHLNIVCAVRSREVLSCQPGGATVATNLGGFLVLCLVLLWFVVCVFMFYKPLGLSASGSTLDDPAAILCIRFLQIKIPDFVPPSDSCVRRIDQYGSFSTRPCVRIAGILIERRPRCVAGILHLGRHEKSTPNSDRKNSLHKMRSKGWVARAPFLLMGNAVGCSKGWARWDTDLVMQTGSTMGGEQRGLQTVNHKLINRPTSTMYKLA